MELADFNTADDHATGAEMQVKTRGGEPTDCYIKLVGYDSPLWQKIMRERQRMQMVSDLAEVGYIDTDALDYARATLDWRGFTDNGEEIEFSIEKACQLYVSAPYILEQVGEFVSSHVNFTKG